MRRVLTLGLVIAASALVSACGGATLTAQPGTAVTPEPLISIATTVPNPTPVAPSPLAAAQTQAVQLEAAEEQYATCFAYAGLDQGLVEHSLPANTPVTQTCTTAGLTPAVAQMIRSLVMEST